jgi:hypothetical protein
MNASETLIFPYLKYKLKMFKNQVASRIFVSARDERGFFKTNA